LSNRTSLPDWLLAMGEFPECGYVLTDAGRLAIADSGKCECETEIEDNGCYVCPDCSTVHDVVVGASHRRLKTWGSRRWYSDRKLIVTRG